MDPEAGVNMEQLANKAAESEVTVYNPHTRIFEVRNQNRPSSRQIFPDTGSVQNSENTEANQPPGLESTSSQVMLTSSESRPPQNEVERQAFDIYRSYFGPNWQAQLRRALFMDIRSATVEDRQREGPHVGWVSTSAESTDADNKIIKNHIVVFDPRGSTDFPLRTEIGEALYNLLENTAVTRSLPANQDGVASGFESLVQGSVTPAAVVEFSRDILDRWNQSYTERSSRYVGMNPDSIREYGGIPEWKSEGFADAIAIEIKKRSGRPLDAHEQQIWGSLNIHSQEITRVCTDAFIPPVLRSTV